MANFWANNKIFLKMLHLDRFFRFLQLKRVRVQNSNQNAALHKFNWLSSSFIGSTCKNWKPRVWTCAESFFEAKSFKFTSQCYQISGLLSRSPPVPDQSLRESIPSSVQPPVLVVRLLRRDLRRGQGPPPASEACCRRTQCHRRRTLLHHPCSVSGTTSSRQAGKFWPVEMTWWLACPISDPKTHYIPQTGMGLHK